MVIHDGGTNGDQRVTNAVLAIKIDQLNKQLQQWHDDDCRQHEELSRRVNILERGSDTRQQSIDRLRRDVDEQDRSIDDLKVKSSWWNIGNSIGAIVAGIVAFFKP